MLLAIILGLRFSAIVLWLAVLFRVTLHWRAGAPVNQQRADLEKVGLWWRVTWGTVAVSVLVFSVNQIAEIGGGGFNVASWIFALVAINVAGAMVKAGFLINRGAKSWVLLPLLAIPALFAGMAMWGFR